MQHTTTTASGMRRRDVLRLRAATTASSITAALGKPTPRMTARCRAEGTKVIGMVATVPDALEMAGLDVDAIITRGGEAGGPGSTIRCTRDRASG